MQSAVELHSRLNVSTLQSSVVISGDLKSQRGGFLYTQEVTSFPNKVEILLWQITSPISTQSMMIHITRSYYRKESAAVAHNWMQIPNPIKVHY